MRTLLRLGAVTSFALAVSMPAQSQGILGGLGKKIGDAVSQKAQDKVNSKIDEMSQKMVDNTWSTMFGDSAAAGANAKAGGGSSPFAIGSNAKTEDAYTFNVVSTMEIESSKNADKAILKMHFNTEQPYTGTSIVIADPKKAQQGNAFIVLDAKNQAMVMMMASDKKKFSIAYDWKDAMKFAQQAPKEQVNWDTVKVWRNYSKIGTKTIAGFSADGYKLDSQEGNVEMWVSHDSRLSVGNMFAANSGLKQMQGRLPADYPQGMLLQMVSTNKNSGEKVTMTVTSIDTNAHVTYAMAEYPKMDMGKK
jgi:hypothetical protein